MGQTTDNRLANANPIRRILRLGLAPNWLQATKMSFILPGDRLDKIEQQRKKYRV